MAQWQNSREVVERVYISGQLVLETPAHFGNGDVGALTDMPLLYDSLDGKSPLLTGSSLDRKSPLLTGSSIAGALRNYLREYEKGYGVAENKDGMLLAEKLFGHIYETEDENEAASVESWLMVDDALGQFPEGMSIEIREGVVIDGKTRTAEVDQKGKGKKFDIELLAAGTTFTLNFELWLTESNRELLEALALALKGLEEGKIGLGMRKRRGYGHCRVTGWRVSRYKMGNVEGMLDWLTHVPQESGEYNADIMTQLEVSSTRKHQGEAFRLIGTFRLSGSLLIRSYSGDGNAADMVHLKSWRKGKEAPILSGTSLAGVLRSRAFRIAKTLKGEEVARNLIDGIFGKRLRDNGTLADEKTKEEGQEEDKPTGSRLIVYETVIKNGIVDRVQNRVKLDRFTGGAYPQALFNQQPVFGKAIEPTQVKIHLELRKTPNARHFDAEVGLLLLVLKDLWTGDLPLGAESSIGRGRLQGEKITLSLGETSWILTQSADGSLQFGGNGNRAELEETYLQALKEL